ncbi:MAG: Cytochrome c family protein [Chthoniobacteraceae bacterium]|nr:Cytochrome c family protein [Chthoniobacteraceae bacterium]
MANIFPRGSNILPLKIILCLAVIGTATTAGFAYYFTNKYTNVGYQPTQPVPFPHDIHVKQVGMDCRYCHSAVEVAAHSNIPTTQVCMNCHGQVQKDSPKLQAVRDSWQTGKPIEWVQIHKTPDYAYFNHSAHVNRGVSCVSCHGQINEMPVVYHAKPLSMDWCLECHRHPEDALRPLSEITNLDWKPTPKSGQSVADAQQEIGLALKTKGNINPPDSNCAGCHR